VSAHPHDGDKIAPQASEVLYTLVIDTSLFGSLCSCVP
jgi:hypothetical protein